MPDEKPAPPSPSLSYGQRAHKVAENAREFLNQRLVIRALSVTVLLSVCIVTSGCGIETRPPITPETFTVDTDDGPVECVKYPRDGISCDWGTGQ